MGIKGGDLVARCHCRTRWRIDNRQNRLRGGYWKGAAKRNVEGGKAWPTIPQRAVLLTSIEEDSTSAPSKELAAELPAIRPGRTRRSSYKREKHWLPQLKLQNPLCSPALSRRKKSRKL